MNNTIIGNNNTWGLENVTKKSSYIIQSIFLTHLMFVILCFKLARKDGLPGSWPMIGQVSMKSYLSTDKSLKPWLYPCVHCHQSYLMWQKPFFKIRPRRNSPGGSSGSALWVCVSLLYKTGSWRRQPCQKKEHAYKISVNRNVESLSEIQDQKILETSLMMH